MGPAPGDPRLAPGRRRAHGDRPVQLVVVGDSFSFTDERGPRMPDDPDTWPSVVRSLVAVALGVPVEVQVLSHPARTVRDGLVLVRKDRHVQFEVLAAADAVVVALGSYDHAPIGVPAPVAALVPFLRPPSLRRRVRERLHAAHPRLVAVTGGRFARAPLASFERDYRALLAHVRGVAHGAAGVVVGPSSHRSDYYAQVHPGFRDREARQLALAADEGFAPVAPWDLVRTCGEELNLDGIHWPRAGHALVAAAISDALVSQLRGLAPRPPRPGREEGGAVDGEAAPV